MAGFAFGDNLISIYLYKTSSFVGSMWFMPFFLLKVYHLVLRGLVIGQGFLILVGWSILVVRVYTGSFLILVRLICGFNITVLRCFRILGCCSILQTGHITLSSTPDQQLEKTTARNTTGSNHCIILLSSR